MGPRLARARPHVCPWVVYEVVVATKVGGMLVADRLRQHIQSTSNHLSPDGQRGAHKQEQDGEVWCADRKRNPRFLTALF